MQVGNLDAIKALNKAKITLMTKPDSTFFCTTAFSLKHVFDDSIPTAATNGLQVKYNTQFFMSLTSEERVFLILHETMHVAYMHMIRAEKLNKQIYNMAADYVINLQLINRNFVMPPVGLLDRAYEGMSTEEVYKELIANNTQPDSGGIGMDLESPEQAPEELTEAINDILIRAAMQSKMAGDKVGSIPGEIEIFINGLLKPKLPWYQILRKYMTARVKEDYSYRRPNKRYLPEFYLPSLYREGTQEICVFVDCSGSVEDEQFKHFITEIHKIIASLKPTKITTVQFDTQIIQVNTVKTVQELSKVKFKGRGGTSIVPVMDWINEHKPAVSLIFTDGDFLMGNNSTKHDVVWLIHNNNNFKANYGKVIHYVL